MGPAEAKPKRVEVALRHQERDRVPVGEFFWTAFGQRCKEELDVGEGFSGYHYRDLDSHILTCAGRL